MRSPPGARDELEKEKRASLSPEEREAWDKYRADLESTSRRSRKRGKNDNRSRSRRWTST